MTGLRWFPAMVLALTVFAPTVTSAQAEKMQMDHSKMKMPMHSMKHSKAKETSTKNLAQWTQRKVAGSQSKKHHQM